MKTKKFLGCLAALAMTLHVSAQVAWDTDGNTAAGLDWFGADASSIIPLRIRNDANQPIEWYTAAVRRMLLSPTLLGQNVNGYTGLDLSGHLGLGNFTNLPGGPPPLTMIHLDNLGTEVAGYRPWMHTGVGMSDASEWMYVGMKREAADRQDAVINWSDNREVFSGGQFGPDALRMVFTSPPTSTSVSGSLNGLEIARLIPAVSGDEGFFGIGDYFTAGLQPEERLDILNGRLRIRELPLAANENANLTRYLVADNNGVVFWRNVPGGGGGGGCEWDQVSGSNNLRTAWSGAASGCPDANSLVGIGVGSQLLAKLHVEREVAGNGNNATGYFKATGNVSGVNKVALRTLAVGTGNDHYGLQCEAWNGTNDTYGLHSLGWVRDGTTGAENYGAFVEGRIAASSSTSENHALRGLALVNSSGSATDNYGVRSIAKADGTVTANYGVHGQAYGTGATTSYAIFGTAAAPHWAAYFNGRTHCTSGQWFSSDEGLKTDITDLSDAMAKLMAIEPKSYRWNTSQYPGMGFDDGVQIGFLAQNMEQVLPELVTEVTHPTQYDEEGNVIQEQVQLKAIQYMGVVPVLVAGVKEQQSTIAALQEEQSRAQAELDELRAQLSDLQHALAACCAATPGDGRIFTTPPSNTPDDLNKALEGDARHLHIQPNPFTERTTLHYRLERAGRMQLLANSADGKALKVLQEATLEAGAYQFNWETGELTPGVYYVTLLLDGEPLVKKAVKVMR